jgi:phosphoglycolate phosphatase-like HAD superfamily hydrolase
VSQAQTSSTLATGAWLEVLNPNARLGQVRHALFDFDGTLSTIRHGWEAVMAPLMIEMICGENEPEPQVVIEVEEYIDRSTGTLTIKQMQWLAGAVARHARAGAPRSAGEYKRIYNERLLAAIQRRSPLVEGRLADPQQWMIAGARAFLQALAERGVQLYLASGTDLVYVRREAAALGLDYFFGEQIFGAVGESEEDSKERVIQRLLVERGLSGPELLVVGDGPVEIRFARQAGALALGIAAEEAQRCGLNERKRQRLIAAGADLLITDYLHTPQLIKLIVC